jgi:hypothetical protein
MDARFTSELLAKLGALQRELETLGYALDSRGSREAADVALTTSARIEELRGECAADCHLVHDTLSAPIA